MPITALERASQENWPAGRVRNVVKAFVESREKQFFPISDVPKRMSREVALEWLAKTANVDLNEVKLMDPVEFVQQYVFGSREKYSLDQAKILIHGTASTRYVSTKNGGIADPMWVQIAREELAAAEEVVEEDADFPPPSPSAVEASVVLTGMMAQVDDEVEENRDALRFLDCRLLEAELRFGLPIEDDSIVHRLARMIAHVSVLNI